VGESGVKGRGNTRQRFLTYLDDALTAGGEDERLVIQQALDGAAKNADRIRGNVIDYLAGALVKCASRADATGLLRWMVEDSAARGWRKTNLKAAKAFFKAEARQ
jgi:hypothetical protein